MPMTPFEEICTTFKLKPKPGQGFEAFALEAASRINKCTDAQWKELSEPVQLWTNQTLETREANLKLKGGEEPAPLPELDGWPEPDNAADDGADTAAGNDVGDDGGDDDGDEPSGDDPEDGDDVAGEAEVDDAASDEVTDPETGEVTEGVDEPEPEEQDAPEPPARRQAAGVRTARTTNSKPNSTEKDKKPMANAAAAKKAAVPKPSKKATTRSTIAETDLIKVLAKENPYREGSIGHKVFAKYKDGGKVKEFVTKAKAMETTRPPMAMLRFDIGKGYIKVVPA